MKIQTANLERLNIDARINKQVYNGLDCCITFEIFEVLEEQLRKKNEPFEQLIYNFERAMQAPALVMMERGWLVDEKERQDGLKKLREKHARISHVLDLFARAIWDKGLNHNSPKQLKEFFYDHIGLPTQYKIEKGIKKISTNREALEKLSDYFYAKPVINCILSLRDVGKKISVLETEVSADGRMRTSYNVAGTETGRWSSSSNVEGTGTNLQNITPELRRIFVADPGWKLGYTDGEQAESRVVGLLVWKTVGDPSYLNACESGDLHTTVCRLVWPHLSWTGDPKADRAEAEQLFYRHYTYRDMGKRGGHGTNYYGLPITMAKHLKVTKAIMEDFQSRYCGLHGKPGGAFPGIRLWQMWVQNELRTNRSLTTLLGRKRVFYGRSTDDSTLREAIAYEPQSVVGDLINLALWRLWRYEPRIQVLGQIHDAIVFQYPDDPNLEPDILNSVLALTKIPLTANGRTMTIPFECKVGWNWADANPKLFADGNPLGLAKWKGSDNRRRLD